MSLGYTPEVRQEFKHDRQGTEFILYKGLLEMAHNKYHRLNIQVEQVQLPTQDNGGVCICMATVVGYSKEGEMECFVEYGDASQENVSRNIQPHLMRMAATRSKARALRDAVNVGMTSLDELGGEPEEEKVKANGSNGAGGAHSYSGDSGVTAQRGAAQAAGDKPATKQQLDKLREAVKEKRGEQGVAKLEAHLECSLKDLTQDSVKTWTNRFKNEEAPAAAQA